jgi:hypothetical protein
MSAVCGERLPLAQQSIWQRRACWFERSVCRLLSKSPPGTSTPSQSESSDASQQQGSSGKTVFAGHSCSLRHDSPPSKQLHRHDEAGRSHRPVLSVSLGSPSSLAEHLSGHLPEGEVKQKREPVSHLLLHLDDVKDVCASVVKGLLSHSLQHSENAEQMNVSWRDFFQCVLLGMITLSEDLL